MRRGVKGSIGLSCVEAFLATAEYGSYAAAGKERGVTATTIMRRVLALEIWLRKPLIWEDDVTPTELGDEFIPTAWKVVDLIDKEPSIFAEITKARVHPDAVLTLSGQAFRTVRSAEIAKLMVQSRASLEGTRRAPAPVAANDPLILEFFAAADDG